MQELKKHFGRVVQPPKDIEIVTIDDLNRALRAGQKDVEKSFSQFTLSDLNSKGKDTKEYPIMCAYIYSPIAFETLIDIGVDVHVKDKDGCNLFLKSVKYGYRPDMKRFADMGISMNEPDKNGEYAPHHAGRRILHREFIDDLITLGADMAVKDKAGCTLADCLKEDMYALDLGSKAYRENKSYIKKIKAHLARQDKLEKKNNRGIFKFGM